jgi:hypothetical protein
MIGIVGPFFRSLTEAPVNIRRDFGEHFPVSFGYRHFEPLLVPFGRRRRHDCHSLRRQDHEHPDAGDK